MRLPKDVWKLRDPDRRLAWAVLLLSRYDVLEGGGGHRDNALNYLTSEEAGDLLDLLSIDRDQFLSKACNIDEEALDV